jgi:DNA polymerase III subunit alpha
MNPLNISLAARTDFSIGESSLQIKKLIAAAVEQELTHVAIADLMTMSAIPKFFEAAKKAGITPIAGVTIKVVADPTAKVKDRENAAYRLRAYPKSEQGMRSLFRLLSKGLSQENFYYSARVGLEDVLELEEVVLTTGDLHTVWKQDGHEAIVDQLAQKFGEDLYVEVAALDTPLFDRLNKIALAYAVKSGLRVLITRPALYAQGDDGASDVLRAIASNTSVHSTFLARPWLRDMVPLGHEAFSEHILDLGERIGMDAAALDEALRSSLEVVNKCADYKCEKKLPSLPKMADDEFQQLVKEVRAGWSKRFAREAWGHRPSPADLSTVYAARLKEELGMLRQLNFSGYFLLVQEIVQWSKDNGIRVGPGRGSVGGSLVAYLLGITDIDPIRFGLLFERFISPDRVDLPDADLDFMSGKRHMVVDYIARRFGAENVCGIVNFSTLGAASALRDTARLYGLDPWEYACSKQMEKEHGVPLSLEESAAVVPDIDKFKQAHPIVWGSAVRLEGANRSLSQHAAGVVVAGEPVVNRGVISSRSGHPVVQWDKEWVEHFGLIKMDILGLTTLDLIDLATQYIKERHNKEIDLISIPLDDERVLQAFGQGKTTGVFQFDGGGMKNLLKEMALGGSTLTFDDICAATALFRPGPLDAGLCDRYVQIKQGNMAPYYDHPKLESILGETYGVMAYQEQVMLVCRTLAGFTATESDGVRKAIGKKDAAKMATFKQKFIGGCEKHSGWEEVHSSRLWDSIEGYAAYSFNKSHSYEYSLISYVTMWLKVNYPAEFFAAAMTTIENEEKLASLVADAQAFGLRVLPPDINRSTDRIEIEGEDVLYAPFQAVKGLGSAAASIVELRNAAGGKFTWAPEEIIPAQGRRKEKVVPAHIRELAPEFQREHLGRTKVTSAALERLDKIGALHSVNGLGVPPTHPDRLRDRLSFLPGFTVEVVKADRKLNAEHLAKIEITSLIETVRSCTGCSLQGRAHPVPRMGTAPKFMVVFDAPTWPEEKAGRMMEGEQAEVVKALLKDRGLKFADGYYTALVKSPKPREQKALANDQINGCSAHLANEIKILRPPVIVALGSNSIRYFAPGVKGSPTDLAGKTMFRPDLDATIIFGINPGMLFHDSSKIQLLENAFNRLEEVIN